MNLRCCFFEDELCSKFKPLTLTRPIHDLRIGIYTLSEKWIRKLGSNKPFAAPTREYLTDLFPGAKIESQDEHIMWINPRFLPNDDNCRQIQSLNAGECLLYGDQLVAAVVPAKLHNNWIENKINYSSLKTKEFEQGKTVILENIWELFQLNGKQIEEDIKLTSLNSVENRDRFPLTTLVHSEDIYIDEGAVIEAGAILIAEKGPIYIGKNATIMANTVVRGPAAICENSTLKMGAKIYEETTIGPVCKVGGEISNSIFHSYSNKAHDGYTGNSVFGQWCNLGADTNTSNLKNNYSNVKVTDWDSENETDSGQQFIGTIMGDHSKTGINSMLNTGTLCGVCCNLFSDGYPPKFIPSFSWVSGQNIVPYHFEKAIDAMEKMMERRDVELTPAYKMMMKALFESTSF